MRITFAALLTAFSLSIFNNASLAAPGVDRAMAPVSQVQRAQFTLGHWWLWTYSSLDSATGKWTPYFYERYTVIKEAGSMITIEMSSDDVWPIQKPAHHRLIINFDDCARAIDPSHRGFTVRFFTTSLGDGWQLVSDEHPNLVFTEKFNCAGPLPAEQMAAKNFSVNGHEAPTFAYHARESFYFLNEPGLEGVVASKLFEPRHDYKFEFTTSQDALPTPP